MDYKKKYEQALTNARQEYNTTENVERKQWLEELFPELKESEDEKIRKALINGFNKFDKSAVWYNGITNGQILAWLEKQKEIYTEDFGEFINELSKQFPEVSFAKLSRIAVRVRNWLEKQGGIDNCPLECSTNTVMTDSKKNQVEPKFKVGDSISKKHNSDINKFGIFTITSIADNKYWYNDSVICDFSDQDLWEFVERTKFKKGDWVFHNTAEFIYMIQTIGRDGYGVISRDGKKSVVYYSAEINYRLWTIEDAKDGDVLVVPPVKGSEHSEQIFIFKEIKDREYVKNAVEYYCRCMDNEFASNERGFMEQSDDYFTPATKEQRDTLMKAMKDAGYEWNAEKKELKKIEQKPTDKIEPKFHEGDWVVQGSNILKIRCVGDEYYCFETVGGYVDDMLVSEIDSLYHLWTIQDAKDGDVLAGSKSDVILIFRGIGNTEWDDVIDYYCYYDCYRKDFIIQEDLEYWGNTENNQLKPATKEQRELLFQKMKEFGYKWDAEKKELKKIPNAFEECEIVHVEHGKYYYCIKDYYAGGNKRASKGDVVQALNGMNMMALGVKANEYFIPVNFIKCYSAWSEDDEEKFRDVIRLIEQGAPVQSMRDHYTNWFKSLKERVQPQPKQEWCVDDNHEYFSDLLEKDDCDNIDDYAYQCAYCMSHDWIKESPTWDDVERACKLGAEWNEKHHKSAWSEEDKDFMYDTLSNLAELKGRYGEGYGNVGKCIDWLKSIKDRIQPIHEYSDTEKQEMFIRSQRPHFWRPSDEQMDALNDVISSRDIKYDVLSELWKDLNKLRGK